MGQTLTSIKVPSEWRTPEGNLRQATAEFKLGVGPCGKEVTKLATNFQHTPGFVCIVQDHADGTSKDFSYPLALITGRIEETYE